ncbi:hypothetical protein ACET3Z_026673 [Daucus carota]
MESAIDYATLDVGQAQRILQGLLGRFRGSRNPPRRRGRPPVTPVEPEPGTYYTHVGSSSSDRGGWSHLVGTSSSPVGDVEGTSRADGWDSWPKSTVPPSTYAGDDYEGGPRGFTVRLEDDEDMSAEGQQQESYQFQDADAYCPDMSFLGDQYTTPPPQAPVLSFASQSYIFGAPAFPFAPPPVRSTPTPIQMSTFASYTGESSPWAPPSTAVAGQSEAEEQPEDEHRHQPPRAAKGNGRRCHTRSHIFGHKKNSIINAMNNITLDDEEDGGLALEEIVGAGETDGFQDFDANLCLVGRFITEGVVDFPAMRQTLAALWRPGKGHSEKFCSRIFDTPENEITRPYGSWMRAPFKRQTNLIGERWLWDGNGAGERNTEKVVNAGEDFSARNQEAVIPGVNLGDNATKTSMDGGKASFSNEKDKLVEQNPPNAFKSGISIVENTKRRTGDGPDPTDNVTANTELNTGLDSENIIDMDQDTVKLSKDFNDPKNLLKAGFGRGVRLSP